MQKRAMLRLSLAVILAACATVAGFWLLNRHEKATAHDVTAEHAGSEEAEQAVLPVTAIHPKADPSFTLTVERPATVKPYYQADLQARVAGPVRYIQTTIGARVKKGDRLVEIDVPDQREEVKEKEAIVGQRQKDRDLAVENVAEARAALKTAQNNVRLKETEVESAEAEREYRQIRYRRLEELAGRDAIDKNLLDEARRNYRAAEAAKDAAVVAVEKARLEVEDAQAKLAAAKAEVKLKESLIAVAQADLAQARALLELATVRAQFDGVVVRRNVDPGSFVQNASSGHSEPLLSVSRTDIVTVCMRVPDSYAPYITSGTEAVLEMSELPGQRIHGKVTRFTPSLQTDDRSMLVEVDLWNGTAAEYKDFLAREEATKHADLKEGPLPLLPTWSGKNASAHHPLLPGMYGNMRLVLQQFPGAYVLPSHAIVYPGGRSCVWMVQRDVAHLVPVELQVSDGRLAKVALQGRHGEPNRELKGNEVIVATNQGELSEGQAVKPHLSDWKVEK
jgi:multidrug efflux pump subunit AcrA (membrane-fusion protein)